MSRIGKLPIPVAKNVQVDVDGSTVKVKGPKGELVRARFRQASRSRRPKARSRSSRPNDEKKSRALHGLSRSLLANMVIGVADGYTKTLELQGVGYRATQAGEKVTLAVGFSHPVEVVPPAGHPAGSRRHDEGARHAASTRSWSGRSRRTSARCASRSRTRARASATLGEYVRRKAGKAGKAGQVDEGIEDRPRSAHPATRARAKDRLRHAGAAAAGGISQPDAHLRAGDRRRARAHAGGGFDRREDAEGRRAATSRRGRRPSARPSRRRRSTRASRRSSSTAAATGTTAA